MQSTTPTPETARSPFSVGQLILLASLGGIAPLGIDIYLASIPGVASDLGASPSAVQLTLTGFMIGLALGPLIIGPISDRYGRYRLLVAGVVGLMISSALCAIAPSVGALIAFRVVQGFCGSIAMTLCRALVADVVTGAAAARVYSLLSTVMGIAPIIAPVIGGAIEEWGHWLYVFWILAAISALLTIGVLVLLRETLPPERRQRGGLGTMLANTGKLIRDGRYLSFTLALAFNSGALFAYIAASPFLIQGVMGFSPMAFALVFAVGALGMTATAGFSAATVGRFGALRLTQVGTGFILVGAAGLLVAAVTGIDSPALLLPAMFMIPSGAGFMLGNATALAVERVGNRAGTALAIVGFLQFGMSALVAPLVTVAGPLSLTPTAVIIGLSAVALVASVAVGSRHVRRSPVEVTSAH